MSRKPKRPLVDRIAEAAEAALAAQHYVSSLDILLGIGWLDGNTARRWRQGQVECLESALQTSPERLAEAMTLLQSWSAARQPVPSETEYVARTPQRQTLRFSISGNPTVERLFKTHWVSPKLSEKQQERFTETASHPSELVVIQPLNREWKCHRCGGSGDLLVHRFQRTNQLWGIP